MKKLILVLMIFSVGMTACSKQEKPLTKKQVQASVDSIMVTRIKALDTQAKIDLDHRIAIEVKVKADSILQAKMKIATGDTIKKADKVADKKGVEIRQRKIILNQTH